MVKLIVYMPAGPNFDFFKFSSLMAIKNSGLKYKKEWEFIAITGWNTPKITYNYLEENEIDFFNVPDLRGDWLYKLYQCWNYGYHCAFNEKKAEYCVPSGDDHAFFKYWLHYLEKYAKQDRVISPKLIESGACPSFHTVKNFGLTKEGMFKLEDFYVFCQTIWKDELISEEDYNKRYGRNTESMPFIMPKAIWEKYGPMNKGIVDGITGDLYFFNKLRANKVKLFKSTGSISYHLGAASTKGGKT